MVEVESEKKKSKNKFFFYVYFLDNVEVDCFFRHSQFQEFQIPVSRFHVLGFPFFTRQV